jgi:hypothetical protein
MSPLPGTGSAAGGRRREKEKPRGRRPGEVGDDAAVIGDVEGYEW